MADYEVIDVTQSDDGENPKDGNSSNAQNKPKDQNDKDGASKQTDPKKPVKAKCGEDVAISPAFIAKVRKMERSTSNNVLGSFFALSASADKLLPGKPVTLGKDKISKEQSKSSGEKEKDSEKGEENKGSSEKRDDQKKPEKDGNDGKRERSRSADRETERDRKRGKEEDYYCKLCDAHTNSLLTYETHLQGRKHQKKLAASMHIVDRRMIAEQLKPEEGPPLRSKPKKGATPKIQTKVDLIECPVIGLDYISEIWRLDETDDMMYYCKLCESTCQPNTILNHIIGYRHRLSYLKVHLPKVYEKVKNMNAKKSEMSKILEKHAAQLEDLGGRGKMKVEEEIDHSPSPEPFIERPLSPGGFRDTFSYPRDPAVRKEFDIESIRFYPSETRMAMLQELVSIDPNELRDTMDVSRLEFIVANFKQALASYRSRNEDQNSSFGPRSDRPHQRGSYDEGLRREDIGMSNQGGPAGPNQFMFEGAMRREDIDGRNLGSDVRERAFDQDLRRSDLSMRNHGRPSGLGQHDQDFRNTTSSNSGCQWRSLDSSSDSPRLMSGSNPALYRDEGLLPDARQTDDGRYRTMPPTRSASGDRSWGSRESNCPPSSYYTPRDLYRN